MVVESTHSHNSRKKWLTGGAREAGKRNRRRGKEEGVREREKKGKDFVARQGTNPMCRMWSILCVSVGDIRVHCRPWCFYSTPLEIRVALRALLSSFITPLPPSLYSCLPILTSFSLSAFLCASLFPCASLSSSSSLYFSFHSSPLSSPRLPPCPTHSLSASA